MADKRNNHSDDQPEQAMNRILQAEQQAVAAIGQCKQQVTDIINQAQLTAQRIRQRTDQRITRVNRYCTRQTDAEIENIRQQQADREQRMQDSSLDDSALSAAVDSVSQHIIGIPQDE